MNGPDSADSVGGAEQQPRRDTDELERLVRERTEALERTNRELESFAYSVSHDLRSPLRSVLGYSAALEEDYGDKLGGEARDYLRRITAAAHRMDKLITAILAFSRISRAPLARVRLNLSELAEAVTLELARHYPGTTAVVQPDLTVNADPGLLRVVLTNLLDNAYKFSSREDSARVEFRREADRSGKPFVVRDNGVGFEPQFAEKIFEPFERLYTDDEFPGTGIGLVNCRRIIERHGGKIWAESSPGAGAAFYFTLA